MKQSIFSVVASAFFAAHNIILPVGATPNGVYEMSYLNGQQQRAPTWEDWEMVKTFWSVKIDQSTCPNAGSAELEFHWDYNYQDYINEGMTPEDALQQDCTLFKRERNPRALGSRLVRHVFHDSVGGLDGFVNIHDFNENGGLFSSQKVLLDTYETTTFVDNMPVKDVLSLADWSAWAGHAALAIAAMRVDGRDDEVDEGDIIPEVPVRWGRLSYLNSTVDDTGPIETFPADGPAASGDHIVRYFGDNFQLTERETVVLMGVHTFGGARRVESGYTGMWTQSKNRFNNDYQLQLVHPIPSNCDIVGDQQTCDYYSMAGDDRTDIAGLSLCLEVGRCEGWEQVMIHGIPGNGNKFQWRHSCTAAGEGCNHVMLNIDMGMHRDLDGFICTQQDEDNDVPATRGRFCQKGMIKVYPAGSSCSRENSRVLATCFEIHPELGPIIEDNANDFGGWIDEFAVVFDVILTHFSASIASSTTLQTIDPPPPCSDSDTWFYQRRNGGRTTTCGNVGRKPATRCSLVGVDGTAATVSCPVACGTCPTN